MTIQRRVITLIAFALLISASAAKAQFPNRFFAPYADVLLFPTIDLTAAPVDHFVLAFIIDDFVSPGSNNICRGAWGGVIPLVDNHMADQIAQVRARGGDVMISFGGVAGTELAVAPECDTVAELQAAYQEVIDLYDARVIDMDIEGAAILDAAANDRRAKALANLQQANPGLEVWFTIPAAPSGLVASGVALIENAAQNGVNFKLNTMSFDFGPFDRGDPLDLGPTIIRSMNGSITQLANALGVSETQAAARYAVTVMVGVNDVRPETLFPQGARQVLAHARQRNIARLSIWSLNRDNGSCAGKEFADPKCSGLSQQDFAFTNILRAFTGGGGGNPPPPPPPTAPTAPSNLTTAVNGNAVALNWSDNSQGEDFFEIQRSSGGAFASVGQVGRGAETFTDNPGNGTFTYRVRASRNGISSGFSNTASATVGNAPPPPGAPAAPSNLSTAVSGNTVFLSWNDNSQGEDLFEIQRASGGAFIAVGTVGRGSDSFADTSVPSGSHNYRVRASRNGVFSAFSNTASATIGGGDPNPDPDAWAPFVAYAIGDEVTFGGSRFRCRQNHTSQPGWEPPNVLALWLPL